VTEIDDRFDRVRSLFPDHLGLARGKYLPARIAGRGTGHCATIWGLGYDRSMIPAPGSHLLDGLVDVVATPDHDTVRASWEDDVTAIAIADVALDGEPFPYSARHVLQRAITAWEELGYRPHVGIELEAYVLEPDDSSPRGWRRLRNPRAMVYGTGIANDPGGVIDDVMRTARRAGFRVESINAEFDESQYELTLEYDDALTAADDAFLFRVMAREVALAKGYDLTFLGLPFEGLSGSGVHVNLSLLDHDGNNLLLDPSADDGLSDLAKQAIAGLCLHHRSVAALGAPTVNAYRRLQPASLSGYWANWGNDHRCVANRVPIARDTATRIESRVADGAANIHLAVAAVLTAARLGVAEQLPCPDPETGDGFEDVNTDVAAPSDLSEAIDHLESATDFTAELGQDVVDNFLAIKRAEWDRFIEAEEKFDPTGPVTEWELNEYLRYH